MSDLVLDSLEIRNFRAFRHLRIEQLGRVNLIVGKNNVGKSCLLEAVSVYSQKGYPPFIWELLRRRNELPRSRDERTLADSARTQEEARNAIRYLFYGRPNVNDITQDVEAISIGPLDPTGRLSISVRWYEQDEDEEGRVVYKSLPLDRRIEAKEGIARLAVRMSPEPLFRNYPLNSSRRLALNQTQFNGGIHTISVPANGMGAEQIGDLWDAVVVENRQGEVISVLRIISPGLENVNLIGGQDRSGERVVVAKMEGVSHALPLRSLGEGMNRLFGLACALVSAQNGLLLVDEADTGIHYSVLPEMWRLIFDVAHRLNVQVFATTHSWDCIQAFQAAADANEDEEGLVIRLETHDGDVFPVLFDERKLSIATREQIEVR